MLAKIICVCVFFKMVLYLYSAKIRKFAIIYTFQTLVRSDKRRNLIKGRHLLGVGLLALFISVTVPGISQDVRRQRRGQKQTFSQAVAYNKDSIPPLSDSLKALKDSLHIADSLFKIDSAALQKKSSLERPAFSTAKDSVIEVFTDGQRKLYYYGDVTVKYGNMELSADYMEYDMKTGTVYARGTLDTLSGEVKGQPVMKEGNSTYSMEEVRYNFNTQKARITNMITQQEDGLLHGKNIKMLPVHQYHERPIYGLRPGTSALLSASYCC